MLPADRRRLFEPAFATFKAFDNLTVASSSWKQLAFPASIWQIIQHLLAWQAHQLAQLPGTVPAEAFDEKRSWEAARAPKRSGAASRPHAVQSPIGWLINLGQCGGRRRAASPAAERRLARRGLAFSLSRGRSRTNLRVERIKRVGLPGLGHRVATVFRVRNTLQIVVGHVA
jgi:hypothetical protein